MFAARVMNQFEPQQLAALAKCQEAVDSFALAANRAFVHANDAGQAVNYPAQDYTLSPNHVDLYMARLDEYLDVLSKDVGPLMSRVPDTDGRYKLRLSRFEGDDVREGNDFFGARLKYGAGFSLEDVGGAACNVRTRAKGDFLVEASVIGAKLQLISAGLDASSAQFHSHLQLLGKTWSIDEPIPAGGAALYSEGENTFQTFLEGHTYIQIGWVTVTVGGAVSGGAGYVMNFDVAQEKSSGGACTVERIGVAGVIMPVMFIRGSAYAALEAIVARAGVKGYLTVVQVGVPLEGKLQLGPNPQAPTVIDASFSLGAKLQLEFLSGKLVAFLEVGVCPVCEDFEIPIIEWRGPTLELQLFDYQLRVVLTDLQRIANDPSLGVLTP